MSDVSLWKTEERVCGDCKNSFSRTYDGLHYSYYCEAKLMGVTKDMHVSYDPEKGTCFQGKKKFNESDE